MGQIDGGPAEEDIVLREKALYPQLHELYEPAPRAYWDGWHRQCDAASRIIVNSPWAKSCLESAGIDARKMAIVPVHYEPPQSASHADRLPDRFKASRPLRVLFLGQLNLRKGAARLFEAVRLLRGEPIEFNVVGPASVQIPPSIRAQGNFKYFGAVTRTDAGRYYGAADVFILPTLSDGFAITQLEAQAHALPVIASRFCGPVVTHGLNGLLLSEVTGEAIADCLRGLLAEPGQLARMREHSGRAFATLRDYGRRFIEATCS
jgi:glycosyltransferase involved in cell wall biosynthesis